MPKLPPVAYLPRVLLEEEEGAHRRQCEEREARWDLELADTLATAEEVNEPAWSALLYSVQASNLTWLCCIGVPPLIQSVVKV